MSKAKLVYSLATIMSRAWAAARARAARTGAPVRLHLPQALREAWAEARRIAEAIREQTKRVLAEVARIRFEQSELGRAQRARRQAAFYTEMKAMLAAADAKHARYVATWLRPASTQAAA